MCSPIRVEALGELSAHQYSFPPAPSTSSRDTETRLGLFARFPARTNLPWCSSEWASRKLFSPRSAHPLDENMWLPGLRLARSNGVDEAKAQQFPFTVVYATPICSNSVHKVAGLGYLATCSSAARPFVLLAPRRTSKARC